MMNTNTLLRNTVLSGLFLIPLLAFLVTPSLLFPAVTGKAFAFRILVEVLFVFWLILALRDERYRPKYSPIVGSIILFLVAIGIATVFSQNPYRSFWSNYERMEGYITVIHLCIYFLIAAFTITERLNWDKLWLVFLGSSVIMGFYNLYEIINSIQATGSVARMGASFGNPTYLSAFMLILFFINLFLFVVKRIPWWLFVFVALIQLVVIYYTGTRGAMLGLLAGMGLAATIIAIWGKDEPVWRKLSIASLAAAVLLVAAFFGAKDTQFIQSSPVLSRFAAISVSNIEKQDSRISAWSMAVDGFKEKPILGWGQENFIYVFNEKYDPRMTEDDGWFDKVHNIVLDWLIAGGLIGLMAYLSLFLAAIYVIWRKIEISFIAKSILTGLLAAYFVQNVFVFDTLYGYILFFTLLAYLHHLSAAHCGVTQRVFSSRVSMWLLPLMSIGVVSAALYSANYKPIRASQSHIQALEALKQGDQRAFLNLMENALSYNTFGNPVLIEQLARAAPVFLREDTPAPLLRNYFNLTDREYEKYLAADPRDTLGRLVYGLFLSRFDQDDRAMLQYQKALQLSPNRQSTWLTIGAIYLDQERYEEAVRYFKHAHELEQRFLKPRVWYAISLVYINQKDVALDLLKDVPASALVADDRLINAHIYKENHAELVPLFQERVLQNPNDPQANVSLAVSLVRSGSFAKAAAVLESFVQSNPGYEQDLRFYIREIKAGRDPSR